ELPSGEEAGRRLHSAGEAVVVLVGCGTIAECRAMTGLAEELQQRWHAALPRLRLALPHHGTGPLVRDPSIRVSVFPLLECLPAVRLLVGGAGYNLVHEARALGVPALFLARERKYDDQAARLGPEKTSADPVSLFESIVAELRKPRRPLSCYI